MWDTAGQEKFHNITNQYYKRCDVIIIVFDVTNRESFDKISYWVKAIHDNTDSGNKCKQVLIGNKIDLENERQISKEEGEKMASSYKIKYFETSAQLNIGINEFFKSIITEIFNDEEWERKKEIEEKIRLEKLAEKKYLCNC